MQEMTAGRLEPDRASLVVRAPQDDRDRNNTLPKNFSFPVHVLQKELERFKPLLETAHDLVPFFARKDLRQEVTEPRVMVIARGHFERDSQFSHRRIQPFL